MSYKISIVIEKDEYGYYAYCPELEGCQTQGDSLDEVLANIKEAIALYLETLSDDQKISFLSKEIFTTTMDSSCLSNLGSPLLEQIIYYSKLVLK